MIERTSSDVTASGSAPPVARAVPSTPKSAGSSTSRVEPPPELATGCSHSPRSSKIATARWGPWPQTAAAASPRATDAVRPGACDPGQGDDQVEVDPVAARWHLDRGIGGRIDQGVTGRGWTVRGSGSARAKVQTSPLAAPAAQRRRCAIWESALGGGEEPLEVAKPVSPVTAWVDPVVAKPSGVRPGPNRVRVHAKEASGLRDGKGRVDGARRECGWQAHSLEEMSSPWRAYQAHRSCQ